MLRLVKCVCRLGEEGDRAQPGLVEVERAEAVRRERRECGSRFGLLAHRRQHVNVGALADRVAGRVVLGRLAGGPLHLGQAPLQPADDHQLQHVADPRTPRERPLSDAQGLSAERLGIGQTALVQSLDRPALGDEPVLCGLAQLGGERRHRLDVRGGPGDVAELQPPRRAVLVGLDGPL